MKCAFIMVYHVIIVILISLCMPLVPPCHCQAVSLRCPEAVQVQDNAALNMTFVQFRGDHNFTSFSKVTNMQQEHCKGMYSVAYLTCRTPQSSQPGVVEMHLTLIPLIANSSIEEVYQNHSHVLADGHSLVGGVCMNFSGHSVPKSSLQSAILNKNNLIKCTFSCNLKYHRLIRHYIKNHENVPCINLLKNHGSSLCPYNFELTMLLPHQNKRHYNSTNTNSLAIKSFKQKNSERHKRKAPFMKDPTIVTKIKGVSSLLKPVEDRENSTTVTVMKVEEEENSTVSVSMFNGSETDPVTRSKIETDAVTRLKRFKVALSMSGHGFLEINETTYQRLMEQEDLKRRLSRESEWAYMCLVFVTLLILFSIYIMRGFHSRVAKKREISHNDVDHYLTVKEVLYRRARFLPMFNPELEQVYVHDCGTNT